MPSVSVRSLLRASCAATACSALVLCIAYELGFDSESVPLFPLCYASVQCCFLLFAFTVVPLCRVWLLCLFSSYRGTAIGCGYQHSICARCCSFRLNCSGDKPLIFHFVLFIQCDLWHRNTRSADSSCLYCGASWTDPRS